MDFPLEILIHILAYVDPVTLRSAPLVCKLWHDVLNDDAVWMAMFKLSFPGTSRGFSSVARSHNYRNELLVRGHLLHEYRKGRTTSQGYFVSPSAHSVQLATGAPVPVPLRANTLPVRSNEALHVDWAKNKLTVLDVPQDTIVSCQLRNGKTSSAVQDFVPEGVTCYDWNAAVVVFGRWDGSLACGLIDYKGLLLAKVRIFPGVAQGPHGGNPRARITAVAISMIHEPATTIVRGAKLSSPALAPMSNRPSIGKAGKANAFSADERGLLRAWDVKTGNILWEHPLDLAEGVQVRKLASDGRSLLVAVLDNGTILSVDGVFSKERHITCTKVGQFSVDDGFDNTRVVVDYGGRGVIVWNAREVLVFGVGGVNGLQETEAESHSEARRYVPPAGLHITQLALEDNLKTYTIRDEEIVGGDPLLAGVCLNNGHIHVINVRDALWEMAPLSIVVPNFLTETGPLVEIVDERVSLVAGLTINALVVLVSNHLGKVEVFNVVSGEYMRTALPRLSNTRLTQLQHFVREQGGNVVRVDERGTRGVLVVGPYVQFFTFGDDTSLVDARRKRKGGNKSKASQNEIKNELDDYEYLLERGDLMRTRFGARSEPPDSDEDIQMAMALSLSLNNSQVALTPEGVNADENDDDDEDLRRAMEMSLRESSQSEPVSLGASGGEYDEDLELALALSAEVDEGQWQTLR